MGVVSSYDGYANLIKSKTYTVTPSANSNVAPFTYLAIIAYDADVTRQNFIAGTANITAGQNVVATSGGIFYLCNNAQTATVTVWYRGT